MLFTAAATSTMVLPTSTLLASTIATGVALEVVLLVPCWPLLLEVAKVATTPSEVKATA